MNDLPFNTYIEAEEFFGMRIPYHFFITLQNIQVFSKENGLNTMNTLDDLFGIAYFEGEDARYLQTPIELFPFGKMGVNGIHYGFVIHISNENDYPSGEICPMDSDGVILIGHNTQALFQNLLNSRKIDNYPTLIKKLNLDPIIANKARYDEYGNGLKINVNPRLGWRHIKTTDGIGVFAEEKFYAKNHEHKFFTNNLEAEHFEALADDMRKKGFYASQLFYLKELFWHEWTNYDLAGKFLKEMLIPYEKLNREHLYMTAKNKIDYVAQLHDI